MQRSRSEFLTELLKASHAKKGFSCGNSTLDDYLHHQASQDVKRKLAVCFVLSDEAHKIKGYYTLSNASIERALLPEIIRKKLPPAYLGLPVTLLGRLAIDHRHHRQGLGELLLIDALKRAYLASATIGSMAIVVDPINPAARAFYSKYGFIALSDSGKLFLPMKTVGEVF